MREFLLALLVIPLFVPSMMIFMFWERLNRRLRPMLVGMAGLLNLVIFLLVVFHPGA